MLAGDVLYTYGQWLRTQDDKELKQHVASFEYQEAKARSDSADNMEMLDLVKREIAARASGPVEPRA